MTESALPQHDCLGRYNAHGFCAALGDPAGPGPTFTHSEDYCALPVL